MKKAGYGLAFNAIVGAVGLASLFLMELIASRVVQPGEEFIEPLAIIGGVFAFGLAANVSSSSR